jgi:hypothetical protein
MKLWIYVFVCSNGNTAADASEPAGFSNLSFYAFRYGAAEAMSVDV